MFTLKTLLGCVYVQLLTYEDVSVCISLTWSPRMHTNVQLKRRSHTCFSYVDVSISLFCHMRLMSVSHTFPLLRPRRMFLHNFWHTRQRFWKIVLDRRVCTQVLRLRGAGTNQNTVFCHEYFGVETRLFTVNTVLRISNTNLLRHCFMCQKLDTEKSS